MTFWKACPSQARVPTIAAPCSVRFTGRSGPCSQSTGKPADGDGGSPAALAILTAAGRRQPRRHRVPEPPGEQPQQYRPSASRDRQAGRSAGVVPAALAIQQKLADDNPAVTDFQSDLANTHDNIGFLLAETGKPVEALESTVGAGDPAEAGR